MEKPPLLELLYPFLHALPPRTRREVDLTAVPFRTASGSILLEQDRFCRGYPLLREGVVRVVSPARDGREVLLYRLTPGEHCLLSAAGLLSGRRYAAQAIAERNASGIVLPGPVFNRLVRESEPFARSVYASIGGHVEILVQLLERVSFLGLEQRLAWMLLSRKDRLDVTHQQLADDLACSRENVSRLLERFAGRGLVRLGRRRIRILEPGRLHEIAGIDEGNDPSG